MDRSLRKLHWQLSFKYSLRNKIPAGTTIYRGPVASQGGIYQGGLEYEQIFIETPWKIEGVEVISSKPLN